MTGRPGAAFHIRPTRGWLNDPNGMVHWGGRWHVMFQHNPAAARHADIAWGHVSSPDLASWSEHPVAFSPTPGGPDRGGCWSGVATVVEGDGDEGMDRVAVAYTGILSDAAHSTICVRYASDEGLDDWSAPVVAATQPHGVGVREMRDPFVFSWGGRRWAVLGAWLADGQGLLLWSCDDLENWVFERIWLTGDDPVLGPLATADVWECPQLVEVDGSWVLLVSIWRAGVLDCTVYDVGTLAADVQGRPAFTAQTGGRVDGGRSLYAPQVLQDAPGGGPLLFGWVREDDAPDGAGSDAVAGCLTLPRRLALDGGRLVSSVDPAVRSLFGPVEAVAADGTLPSRAYLRVDSDVARPATLSGGSRVLDLPAGAEVWLDGAVVEIYLIDGTPRTYRDPGTTAWTLSPVAASTELRSLRVFRGLNSRKLGNI